MRNRRAERMCNWSRRKKRDRRKERRGREGRGRCVTGAGGIDGEGRGEH